eukprot:scaffold1974_cov395-Prasinococcus_capsulatus_cf.AAC.10
MADLCGVYGLGDTVVYSVDIDLSLVDPRARDHPRVTFLQANANDPAAAFPPEMLQVRPAVACHAWRRTRSEGRRVAQRSERMARSLDRHACTAGPSAPLAAGGGLPCERGGPARVLRQAWHGCWGLCHRGGHQPRRARPGRHGRFRGRPGV